MLPVWWEPAAPSAADLCAPNEAAWRTENLDLAMGDDAPLRDPQSRSRLPRATTPAAPRSGRCQQSPLLVQCGPELVEPTRGLGGLRALLLQRCDVVLAEERCGIVELQKVLEALPGALAGHVDAPQRAQLNDVLLGNTKVSNDESVSKRPVDDPIEVHPKCLPNACSTGCDKLQNECLAAVCSNEAGSDARSGNKRRDNFMFMCRGAAQAGDRYSTVHAVQDCKSQIGLSTNSRANTSGSK